LTHVTDPADVARRVTTAEAAVTAAGGEVAYDLFYDQPADTPYDAYQPDDAGQSDGILVQHPDGRLARFSEISPLPQALNQRLMFRRLHVAEEYRDTVAKAVQD